MRKIALLLQLFFICSIAIGQQETYHFNVDLTNCEKDRVKVILTPPKIDKEKIIYQMPKVIPGSYMEKNYSRFIKSIKAYNSEGKKLKLKKNKLLNQFIISDANTLSKIEYEVSDTWDDKKKKEYVFQAGGTNIEQNELFILNNFGFFGYFVGYDSLPYTIEINRPSQLYGSTALLKKNIDDTLDIYRADNYFQLCDNPIMYCEPDTLSFEIENTRFYISVFSRNKKVSSLDIKNCIYNVIDKPLADFFNKFFIDEYHFLLVFSGWQDEKITRHGGFGALEHLKSSLYFWPEIVNKNELCEGIRHVVAHEFLHTFAPISFHSEQIEYFDFADPDMSKHLWMYEGATEYFSNIILLKDTIDTMDEFLHDLRMKIIHSQKYKDVSFTTFSKNILKDPYKDSYINVYCKGALLAFLLDIRINELTNGKLDLKKSLFEIYNKFGDSHFEDDKLIDNLISIIHPDIKEFFTGYIIGEDPLPLKEYFAKIGINYYAEHPDSIYYFGRLRGKYEGKDNQFTIGNTKYSENAFGLQTGDILLSVNGIKVTEENFQDLFELLSEPKTNKNVKVVGKRNDRIFEKQSTPRRISVIQLHLIQLNDNATKEQVQLREAVLYN